MIPLRFQAECSYCQDPLDIRRPGVHQYVAGWVENRKGGGTHAIRLPERQIRFACKDCIDRKASGLAKYQPSLFS